MLTIVLFLAALNCMMFYCITIGNYIGKALGRIIVYLAIGYVIGLKLTFPDGQVITIKGLEARQMLKALDKSKMKAGAA
jgi:hypothetical protein